MALTNRFRVQEKNFPYFITSAVTYWLPVFSKEDYFRLLADGLQYCVEHKGLLVHAYVIMPNHFHIISSHQDGKLPSVITDLKGYTSRQIAAKLEEDGRTVWLRALKAAGKQEIKIKFWQDGYHPEQVYSEEFFMQKVNYIHNNPVRAGFVSDPWMWKYSSAGFYYKEEEPVIPISPLMW
ncbi:MAG: transposase [Armatimonadota bacterium]